MEEVATMMMSERERERGGEGICDKECTLSVSAVKVAGMCMARRVSVPLMSKGSRYASANASARSSFVPEPLGEQSA